MWARTYIYRERQIHNQAEIVEHGGVTVLPTLFQTHTPTDRADHTQAVSGILERHNSRLIHLVCHTREEQYNIKGIVAVRRRQAILTCGLVIAIIDGIFLSNRTSLLSPCTTKRNGARAHENDDETNNNNNERELSDKRATLLPQRRSSCPAVRIHLPQPAFR